MRRTITHEMAIARGRSLTGFWEGVLSENSFLSHLHLLNDEVEVVPTSVGKQAGVEGKRNKRRILRISSLAISNFVVIINIVIFI